MKIYLDSCCLNRPFDDQSQPRIHMEAEAIKTVIGLCDQGFWSLVSSDVLNYEIQKVSNQNKRHQLQLIVGSAQFHISLIPAFRERAKKLEQQGVKAFDALHLASAESVADVFLTTDDKLLNRCKQLEIKITVANPLHWVQEVLK